MKIISGSLKGRKIIGYDIEGTRPTMDRVRESLFAMIQNHLPNSIVLDLFAGTGALGVEALSRGAKEVVFCDKVLDAIKVIKQNVTSTNNLDKSIIINKDYKEVLEK